MKIRTDFVTNSSSSSFICVAKVDKSAKLLEYFKEEYGKYGLRLLDEHLVTGKDIKDNDSWIMKNLKTSAMKKAWKFLKQIHIYRLILLLGAQKETKREMMLGFTIIFLLNL